MTFFLQYTVENHLSQQRKMRKSFNFNNFGHNLQHKRDEFSRKSRSESLEPFNNYETQNFWTLTYCKPVWNAHTHLCVSGDYSTLIFRSLAVHNYRMILCGNEMISGIDGRIPVNP